MIRLEGTVRAVAASTDGNGRFGFLDPYLGGAHAVAQVKVPCPSCCGVNHLYFEPSGTVKAVRPCKPAGAIPEPSLN